jgi:hypothetical protein
MIPERDYVLAKDEVRRRREAADSARTVREARMAPQPAVKPVGRRASPFAWLRRLAGAR